MTTQQVALETEPAESDITRLWSALSPAHRQIVLEIAQAFAALDLQGTGTALPQAPTNGAPPVGDADAARQEQVRRNQGAIALIQRLQDEADAMSPEEAAEANADFEDFKRAMNANRAPEPPLFL